MELCISMAKDKKTIVCVYVYTLLLVFFFIMRR